MKHKAESDGAGKYQIVSSNGRVVAGDMSKAYASKILKGLDLLDERESKYKIHSNH